MRSLKQLLKAVLPRRVRRLLQATLGRSRIDEIDLVLRLVRREPVCRMMIDVGAHHGESLEPFALAEWKVYAFEPDANNRRELLRLTKRFPSVVVDSRALSNTVASNLPFFQSAISSGISSLIPFHNTHELSSEVDTSTLRAIIAEYDISTIGLLKIDTEGTDLLVLQGFPWEQLQPDIVVCEFDEKKIGSQFHDLARSLKQREYSVLVSEWFPIVEYGGRHRWRRFATYPCELRHANAWGNLIGIRRTKAFQTLVELAGRYARHPVT